MNILTDPKIYLEKDSLLHADMLDALRDEKTKILFSEEKGVLMEAGTGFYLISAADEETYRRYAAAIPKEKGVEVCIHQLKWAPVLLEGREKVKVLPCWEFSAEEGKKLPENEISGITFRPITEKDLPFVEEKYSEPAEYIRRCFKNGMIGAFEGEKCVGFIGLHPNGEIGLLKVLPAYRNRRIGAGLETRLINRRLEEGRIPFNFVVVGNDVSIRLQQALGLRQAEHMTAWLLDDNG